MNDTYISLDELINEYLGASLADKLDVIAEKLADEVRCMDDNPTYSFNTTQQFLKDCKRV